MSRRDVLMAAHDRGYCGLGMTWREVAEEFGLASAEEAKAAAGPCPRPRRRGPKRGAYASHSTEEVELALGIYAETGNVSLTSRLTGVPRGTLYTWINTFAAGVQSAEQKEGTCAT